MAQDPTQEPVEPDDTPQPWWNRPIKYLDVHLMKYALGIVCFIGFILKEVPRSQFWNYVGVLAIGLVVLVIGLGAVYSMIRLALDNARRL